MTSFDYAYKLEAVRDWLFAQTKLSVPLLALLLSFFGLIFVFLIYPENAPPIKSGALYQNTVPLPKRKVPVWVLFVLHGPVFLFFGLKRPGFFTEMSRSRHSPAGRPAPVTGHRFLRSEAA